MKKISFPTFDQEKRDQLLSIIFSIVVAFAVTGVVLLAAGFNPLQVYGVMFSGSLGNLTGIGFTLVHLIPLALTGLAAAIAFKGGLWNIGGEGQLYLGAIGAEIVGITTTFGPASLAMSILVGFLLGAAGGTLCGVLKAYFDIDEIVTTIMMNFIVLILVQYLIVGPLKDPTIMGFPRGLPVLSIARFPYLLKQYNISSAIILVLVVFVLTAFLMEKTTFGFETKILGSNPLAADYAGVKTKKVRVVLMFLSGGIAGLAGVCLNSGVYFLLTDALSKSYGYVGIAVSLLAGNNALFVIPPAMLFAILYAGGNFVAAGLRMSTQAVALMAAIVIITFLVSKPLFARIKGIIQQWSKT